MGPNHRSETRRPVREQPMKWRPIVTGERWLDGTHKEISTRGLAFSTLALLRLRRGEVIEMKRDADAESRLYRVMRTTETDGIRMVVGCRHEPRHRDNGTDRIVNCDVLCGEDIR